MNTTCPKCGSENARYVADHQDVTLRCRCGYLKVVETRLGQITIRHTDSASEIKLPRYGTNLWWTLVALVALERATSEQVFIRLADLGKVFSAREVASYLTLLRNKGLVFEIEIRRRERGGSTWEVDRRGLRLLGLGDHGS